MIIVTIASMFAAASIDTAATAQRSALSKCLKEAIESAKADKVGLDAFDAYMRSRCAEPEAALRKAVTAIDMKNGISRADAAEGAQMDADGYFMGTAERYEAEMGAMQPEKPKTEVQQAELPQPQ